jgi:hypothetical protein
MSTLMDAAEKCQVEDGGWNSVGRFFLFTSRRRRFYNEMPVCVTRNIILGEFYAHHLE